MFVNTNPSNIAGMIKYALGITLQRFALQDRRAEGQYIPEIYAPDPGAYEAAARIIASIEAEKGQPIDEIMASLDTSIRIFTEVVASIAMYGATNPELEGFEFAARERDFLIISFESPFDITEE